MPSSKPHPPIDSLEINGKPAKKRRLNQHLAHAHRDPRAFLRPGHSAPSNQKNGRREPVEEEDQEGEGDGQGERGGSGAAAEDGYDAGDNNNGNGQSALVTMRLYPWEVELVNFLRLAHQHSGNGHVPDHAYIGDQFYYAKKAITQGIKHFRHVVPGERITVRALTREAQSLISVMFKANISPDKGLKALVGDPAVDVDVLLSAVAHVAVYQWVYQEFDEDRVFEQQLGLEETLKNADLDHPQLRKKIIQLRKLEYLETKVRPEVNRRAEELSRSLFDVLKSLVDVPAHGSEPGDKSTCDTSFSFRLAQDQLCSEHLAKAVQFALHLKIDLDMSPLTYSFQWARVDDPFEPGWMEDSAREGWTRNGPGVEVRKGSVKICQCAAMYSYCNQNRVVVIKARVMVDEDQ